MGSVGSRLRLVIVDYGAAIIVASLVVAAMGIGAVVWFVTHPPTAEVTETNYRDTVSADVTTSTVVTNGTGLFPVGTRLRGLPTYPRPWSDTLTVHARTTLPRSGRISHNLTLVYRVRIGEQTIKRETETLAAEAVTVSEGSGKTRATVNVTRVEQNRDRLAAAAGGFGSVEVTVRFVSEYSTERYSGTLSGEGALEISGDSYSLGGWFAASRTHEDTTTRRVAGSRSPGAYLPWVGLAAFGIAGAGLTWRRYVIEMERGEAVDRDALVERIQRERFEEWIVEGRLSAPPTGETIRITSIEGLFEVAIAEELRVIYDSDAGVYAVVDSARGITYHYGDWTPPDRTDPERGDTDRTDRA